MNVGHARYRTGVSLINAYSLSADDLGPLRPKATPPHNTLPAIYLSMIAIDKRSQGLGLGSILLHHAKQKALAAADQVGAFAMVLHVLDDDVAAETRVVWYARHGFQSFPSNRLKMFLPVETVRRPIP